MSARVRVRHAADGQLVAVKVGLDAADDIGLVHEAAMLAAARHPGVVGLVGLGPGAGGLELITRWIGGRSLADVRPLPASDAAGVIGALAATVADLHRHGIVHGAIEPTHALLDRRGRPILCSFGRAGLVAATNAESPGPRPADDVAALGALLASVVGMPGDPELVPHRRFARRQTNHLHRSLLTTADHAQADDPASRPSAASLACALAALAPEAALPATDDQDSTLPPVGAPTDDLMEDLERLRATAALPNPRRRRWPFVGTALAAAVALAGTTAVVGATISRDSAPIDVAHTTGAESHPPPVARPSPTASPTSAQPQSDTTVGATTPTREPSSGQGATPVIDLGGRRFRIGEPGDRVALGAWRCDGHEQVLLLRPATGEVFLFDDAPPPGADRAVASFARFPGAIDLAPVEQADDCPTATLVHDGGRVSPIVNFPVAPQ